MSSYVNRTPELSGYRYQDEGLRNVATEPKSDGLVIRLMRRFGLAVDPQRVAHKKKLDSFINQPLNIQSERGLHGLEGGGRNAANRTPDALLNKHLDDIISNS